MTPSRRTMLALSNCPRIPASLRNKHLCFSEQPTRRVFMATGNSRLLGSFRQPRACRQFRTAMSNPVIIDQWGTLSLFLVVVPLFLSLVVPPFPLTLSALLVVSFSLILLFFLSLFLSQECWQYNPQLQPVLPQKHQ